ncbi:putative LRR receptor-like serine/threonine-protein kinase [Sesamum angolense]|uniref:LRR receptor-like serine/threonine-protein kinase n=1 Tax=Sesamum angolense TaxID=2727404 RepID=A0AAE1WD84_9LAMI|nr:putative LRR receptor-like serine/threonine-protein kinase [Sesamum angolense]
MLNNETDLQALLAFKNAIDDDPMGVFNSWNGTFICSWTGILCSKRHQNRVVSIDLMSQGLVGSLSPHLGNLSFLRSIVLQNNSFHGQIPEEMGRLRRLEWIEFSNISFGEAAVAEFRRQPIDRGIPSGLYNISSINNFSLRSNQLRGTIPPDIGLALPNLSGEIIKDFEKLSALDYLIVSSNHLEGDISFITSMINCTSLEALSVFDNLLTGSLPDSIGNLSSHLSFLSVAQNQLHGRIPPSIGDLFGLTSIDFSYNDLEGPIPFSIEQFLWDIPQSLGNCSNLLALDLSRNNLNGSIPPEIMSLSSISIALNLSNNFFTGSIPSEVGSLRNLVNLDFSHNRLSGSIPNSLSSCVMLERLHLDSNGLNGEIPDVLRSLRGLQDLDLSQNNITGPIPRFLSELLLVNLNLSFNRLQGEVPTVGVFQNESAISLEGNSGLCGDLLKATGGFSEANLLGAGRFGSVYKGVLRDEQTLVAVKVLNLSIKGASKSFLFECNALRGIRHRNLLKILSICPSTDFQGNDFKALVYEFMANGSLEKWLHQIPEAETES